MNENTRAELPGVEADRGRGRLPSAVTFFLTGAQRGAVLRLLGTLGDDRGAALLIALGLDDNGSDENGNHGGGRDDDA